MGSKNRIAKHIVPILQEYIDKNPNAPYIEPFVGGANIIDKIKAKTRVGVDINKYLIALFKHLQADGSLPDSVSKSDFDAVRGKKDFYPEWYVGCVGFLAGFNGRFFDGGYAKTGVHGGKERNYYDEAKRNLLMQAEFIKDVKFDAYDYRNLHFKNAIAYCDPPYSNGKRYSINKDFDSNEFWEWARRASESNQVIISEQNAPEDFECIWEQEITRNIHREKTFKAVEKLFVWKGGRA